MKVILHMYYNLSLINILLRELKQKAHAAEEEAVRLEAEAKAALMAAGLCHHARAGGLQRVAEAAFGKLRVLV